ncbi:protein N-acetylglucosaminyltransferase [Aureococcus anophagefferens]|nr:protein N-acetylglucosaminyltransferase [Aureococcus anophagefferens]
MGAASSVGDPVAAAAAANGAVATDGAAPAENGAVATDGAAPPDGAAAPPELTEEQKAAKAAEEEAAKLKANQRKSQVFDAAITKAFEVESPRPAEPVEPVKVAPRAEPYYTSITIKEKSALLKEFADAGRAADAGIATDAAEAAAPDAAAPPPPLAYKLDVYDIVMGGDALTDEVERAKKMDTAREIMIAAMVAATRLAAALRGRQERIALAKKGKKTKKPGKKKGKKK